MFLPVKAHNNWRTVSRMRMAHRCAGFIASKAPTPRSVTFRFAQIVASVCSQENSLIGSTPAPCGVTLTDDPHTLHSYSGEKFTSR